VLGHVALLLLLLMMMIQLAQRRYLCVYMEDTVMVACLVLLLMTKVAKRQRRDMHRAGTDILRVQPHPQMGSANRL
jgi:hypothetical protein